MSQGLCMFDAQTRIVARNVRYLEMYKLSPEVVRPGCSLRELKAERGYAWLAAALPSAA